MRRAKLSLLAAAAAALLTACTSASGQSAPTFEPSNPNPSEGQGVRISPIVPLPSPSNPGGPSSGSGAASTPGQPSSSAGKADPAVVATDLTAPIGLTILPDGTALVGERTTGRIVRVQPTAGQPVPVVKTITGIDAAGDGGLLDLALSPTYDEDNLVYAYITTKTDNRVVDFTLNGPVTPVVTGIPRGATGNGGRIVFGADGDLYIGTGDAGHPTLAADPSSLAGKVLRVDDIGKPAGGNPTAGSSVWTSGHQAVDGICGSTTSTTLLEVEPGQTAGGGEVNALVKGAFYGWPSGAGSPTAPIAQLPASTSEPGDCAQLGGRLWVTSPDGQSLLSAALTGSGAATKVSAFSAVLIKKYGRLKTVVAATDGALWLTTTNKDGHGTPVPTDERVIRYVPSGGSSKSGAPV